jgi:hypothetical protein
MEGQAKAGCGAHLSYSYPVNSANALWLQDDARCKVKLTLALVMAEAGAARAIYATVDIVALQARGLLSGGYHG